MRPAEQKLRWYREPLIHFAILGGILFGLDGWLGKDEREIVATRALQQHLLSELQRELGRQPEPREQETALRHCQREEALYREGLALGLDRNDPVLRQRIANR